MRIILIAFFYVHPKGLKYSEEHEWVKILEDNTVLIGITDFAQSELGELVYVDIDTIDSKVEKGEVFGVVEAVKTTSDLFMPVTGTVLEANPAIIEGEGDNPGLVNEDPYGEGWIIKVEMDDLAQLDELMNAEQYEEHIG